jgi:hypothetical protein
MKCGGHKMNMDVLYGFFLGLSVGLIIAIIRVIQVFLPKPIKLRKARNDPNDTK